MIYISTDDFFKKTSQLPRLGREEELEYAKQMKNGDQEARKTLICGYLPMVAAHIKRQPQHLQTLELVMRCQATLEKAVDSFDFSQNGETFTHRLSWHLRQTVTRYVADRSNEGN